MGNLRSFSTPRHSQAPTALTPFPHPWQEGLPLSGHTAVPQIPGQKGQESNIFLKMFTEVQLSP